MAQQGKTRLHNYHFHNQIMRLIFFEEVTFGFSQIVFLSFLVFLGQGLCYVYTPGWPWTHHPPAASHVLAQDTYDCTWPKLSSCTFSSTNNKADINQEEQLLLEFFVLDICQSRKTFDFREALPHSSYSIPSRQISHTHSKEAIKV